jgi:hypothetical protein
MNLNRNVYPVTDARFCKYGSVVKGFDCTQLLEKMKETPLPDGVIYIASVPELEKLSFFLQLTEREFGGMPIQLGFCNGNNHKLNAAEYHRTSEVDVAATDLIMILGMRQDISTNNYTYDTSYMDVFHIPAGTMVELYATTLHYAPCNYKTPFRCAVALPRGTGEPLKEPRSKEYEDALLFATNKWVIGHPESDIGQSGGFVGLIGENPTIEIS